MINGKLYLCIVNYHRKFSVMREVKGLRAVCLIKCATFSFQEYGLSSKIVSYIGTNVFQRSSKILKVTQHMTGSIIVF